ncbi:MAG: ComF family protein [Vallitaleaceae bacterium]|nr:ComF family protein [Vallitaleaceae bacterium]
MWLYEGKVKKAIHTYKYHLRKSHGKAFAQELYQFYTKHVGWKVDVITCVPLHPSKMKERSFNQAAYLATLLGEKLEVKVDNNLLVRTKNTRPQKDLTDIERIVNLENAFEMNKQSGCQNQRILIVDDIYTTGSTIDNCAKILLKQGAKDVYFLTLAIGKGY